MSLHFPYIPRLLLSLLLPCLSTFLIFLAHSFPSSFRVCPLSLYSWLIPFPPPSVSLHFPYIPGSFLSLRLPCLSTFLIILAHSFPSAFRVSPLSLYSSLIPFLPPSVFLHFPYIPRSFLSFLLPCLSTFLIFLAHSFPSSFRVSPLSLYSSFIPFTPPSVSLHFPYIPRSFLSFLLPCLSTFLIFLAHSFLSSFRVSPLSLYSSLIPFPPPSVSLHFHYIPSPFLSLLLPCLSTFIIFLAHSFLSREPRKRRPTRCRFPRRVDSAGPVFPTCN